jgi:hypothetical protein
MLADLFKILGIYLKRQVRHTVVTVILLLAGTIAVLIALGMGVSALYLWLQIELGTFAALAILGWAFALLGSALLGIALLRNRKKRRNRQRAELVAVHDALDGAVDTAKRNPRQAAIVTILLTILFGWIVGRRIKR